MRICPTHIWNWACKDWQLFLADRQGVVLCFAVPILLASAFSLIFQRDTNKATLPQPHVLVVLGDQSQFTRCVAADLQAAAQLQVDIVDPEQAQASLQRGESVVVVQLPADLDKSMQDCWESGAAPPGIAVCQGDGDGLECTLVEGVVTATLMQRLVQNMLAKVQAAVPITGMGKPGKEVVFTPPFQMVRLPSDHSTGHLKVYSHTFCGMTIQYLLFLGMDSGLLLLRERRQGIWRRLRTCPVSLESIVLGKSLSILVIALLQILITFTAGYLLFGVSIRGSVLGFFAMSLVIAMLVASIGLLVAAVGATESRARSISILVILALSMIGGLWLPAFLFPDWVQRISELVPTSWAMRGLQEMVTPGFSLQAVLPSLLLLLACSAVFLTIALWRFRRSECIQEN